MADENMEGAQADALARRVAETLLAQEGTGPAWALQLEEVREGYARVSMVVRSDMLNGHRIAHGAMIFALADSAFAYACNSRNMATVAQHASIAFLNAGQAGERLTAEAEELSLVGRTGVYRMVVRGEDGRTVAEMQGLSRSLGRPVVEPGGN